MDRRSFFSLVTQGGSTRFRDAGDDISRKDRGALPIGLEPYTESLDRAQAYHLLRRITFAPTLPLVNQLIGLSAAEAADLVLGTGEESAPEAPGAWIDESTENPDGLIPELRNQIESGWRRDFGRLQAWWVNLMLTDAMPSVEKLTLFWSGHFTTEFAFDDMFNIPQLLYRQNRLIRGARLGPLADFVESITVDGAMLAYLGGELNVAGSPNENYSRELLELYTTGLGWYTEPDVQEGSRILTGWKIAKYDFETALNGIYNTYFWPPDHDTENKFYLETQFDKIDQADNTEVGARREVRKMIDTIFDRRADAVAKFISDKIYRFFVYSNPLADDQGVIDEMATVFKDNNFQIRPVIAALLSSAHFYDEANVGIQIKTPAEFVVGLARQMGATPQNMASVMASVEQNIIDPPDVSGWNGYRTWIGTKTYPLRSQYAQEVVNAMSDQQLFDLANQFPGATDPDVLMRELEEYFFPVPVTEDRHQRYFNALLGDAMPNEWGQIISNVSDTASRMRSLMSIIIKAPDFHLT